jgi:hypothetical protein
MESPIKVFLQYELEHLVERSKFQKYRLRGLHGMN